jgi:hypothetical protein
MQKKENQKYKEEMKEFLEIIRTNQMDEEVIDLNMYNNDEN